MYHRYYHMCRRYVGRRVAIRCRGGVVHHGRIVRVSPTHVYLTPVGAAISGDAESKKGKSVLKTAVAEGQATAEEVLFFSPFAVPFAAIAGISLIGAAAAASPFFWW